MKGCNKKDQKNQKDDKQGKRNPKSKKMTRTREIAFTQDQSYPNKESKLILPNQQKTYKKTHLTMEEKQDQIFQSPDTSYVSCQKMVDNIITVNAKKDPRRKKQLKKSSVSSVKVNNFIYFFNPSTQKMKKQPVLHDADEIDSKLKNYIPPAQSCDQDVESSDQVVKNGVQRSKRDLLESISRLKEAKKLKEKDEELVSHSFTNQETCESEFNDETGIEGDNQLSN